MNYEIKREIYPIELIRTGIFFLDIISIRPRKGFYPYDATRALILYHLQSCEDGFLPLNREYKPLGISRYMDYVNYEDFGFLKIPKEKIDLTVLTENLFTFKDNTFPSNAKSKKRYVDIINKLFKNEIDFETSRGYEY